MAGKWAGSAGSGPHPQQSAGDQGSSSSGCPTRASPPSSRVARDVPVEPRPVQHDQPGPPGDQLARLGPADPGTSLGDDSRPPSSPSRWSRKKVEQLIKLAVDSKPHPTLIGIDTLTALLRPGQGTSSPTRSRSASPRSPSTVAQAQRALRLRLGLQPHRPHHLRPLQTRAGVTVTHLAGRWSRSATIAPGGAHPRLHRRLLAALRHLPAHRRPRTATRRRNRSVLNTITLPDGQGPPATQFQDRPVRRGVDGDRPRVRRRHHQAQAQPARHQAPPQRRLGGSSLSTRPPKPALRVPFMSQSPLTPWSRCSHEPRLHLSTAQASTGAGLQGTWPPEASPPLRPHLHHGRARQGPVSARRAATMPASCRAWTSPSTGRTSTTRTTPTVRSTPSSSPSRADLPGPPLEVFNGLPEDNRKRFEVRHQTAQGPLLVSRKTAETVSDAAPSWPPSSGGQGRPRSAISTSVPHARGLQGHLQDRVRAGPHRLIDTSRSHRTLFNGFPIHPGRVDPTRHPGLSPPFRLAAWSWTQPPGPLPVTARR